jgi:hypothetical protein
MQVMKISAKILPVHISLNVPRSLKSAPFSKKQKLNFLYLISMINTINIIDIINIKLISFTTFQILLYSQVIIVQIKN